VVPAGTTAPPPAGRTGLSHAPVPGLLLACSGRPSSADEPRRFRGDRDGARDRTGRSGEKAGPPGTHWTFDDAAYVRTGCSTAAPA